MGQLSFSSLNRPRLLFFGFHPTLAAFPRKVKSAELKSSDAETRASSQRALTFETHAFAQTHLFRFGSFDARLLVDIGQRGGSRPEIELRRIQIRSDSIIQHNCITLMEARMATHMRT